MAPDKTIGKDFDWAETPGPVNLTTTTTDMTQWSKQISKKRASGHDMKVGGEAKIKVGPLELGSLSGEESWDWSEEDSEDKTEGGSKTGVKTITKTLNAPAKSAYGWSPLVTRRVYRTTYYHEDGSVTSKDWVNTYIHTWVMVIYDNRDAVQDVNEP
ncbi:hypothetical protein [Kitasatospora sp. NPDC054795]